MNFVLPLSLPLSALLRSICFSYAWITCADPNKHGLPSCQWIQKTHSIATFQEFEYHFKWFAICVCVLGKSLVFQVVWHDFVFIVCSLCECECSTCACEQQKPSDPIIISISSYNLPVCKCLLSMHQTEYIHLCEMEYHHM